LKSHSLSYDSVVKQPINKCCD